MFTIRKIARSTDERTMISTITPINGLGDSGTILMLGAYYTKYKSTSTDKRTMLLSTKKYPL